MSNNNKSLIFLFTDIEGSARLWSEQRQAMAEALAWHDQTLRRCIESHGGEVVKRTGDGVHAAFADAKAAVAATVDIQQAMQGGAAPTEGAAAPLALSVRCGLHAGYDEAREGDYFGPEVNRAARIMSVAHGGQMLLSDALATQLQTDLPAGWTLRDLGRVRLRGFNDTDRLWQLTVPGLREDFPPLRELAEVPHNLPAPTTRFFNREQELAQLADLLLHERLVLLHGLGGMGKTRLAIEAARRARPHFADGVWLVELAQTRDPTLVPLAVAAVLGVKEEAGRTLTEAIARMLSTRHALIVLDNCEQVVDACARLVDELLPRAPQLHVLSTSREPLRLTAERVVEIGGFELPAVRRDRAASTDEWARSAALSLFVDRMQAVQPAFRLGDETTRLVGDICRRLDGIPLALELAAAATRRMPLARLTERLEDRLGTLVHGTRVASERQATLRGLIDWSHELLSPPQQQIFQRLAVFAGGWTLEAAEAVCADDTLPAESMIEWLGELVEKSLVQMDPVTGRYRMLDTVRQYAQERLAASAEVAAAAQAKHLQFHLALAESARPHLGGPEQKTWLATLDLERDNLLAAHQACRSVPAGPERGARLSWALKPYWLNRGLLGTGLRLCVDSLEWLKPDVPDATRCAALADAGQMCVFVGQYARAQNYLEACLRLARTLGDGRLEVAALQPLAMACLAHGDLDAAASHLEAACERARQAGNRSFQAYAENTLGQIHRVAGRFAEAERLSASARAAAQAQEDRDLEAITRLNDAMTALDARGAKGAAPAAALLGQVLDMCEESGSHALVQSTLEVACGLACVREAWPRALEFWSWAEAMARHSGLRRDPADEAFMARHLRSLEAAVGASVLHQTVARADLQPVDAAIVRLRDGLFELTRPAAADSTVLS